MSDAAPVPASHRGHVFIQWVLRGGLALAVVLMVIGLVLAIAGGEHGRAAVHLAHVLSEGSVGDRFVAVGLAILAFSIVTGHGG